MRLALALTGTILLSCARSFVAGPSLDDLQAKSKASPNNAPLHYELFLKYAALDSTEAAKAEFKSLVYLGSSFANDEYARLKMAEFLGLEPFPARPLTKGFVMCRSPNFFPDGQRLVFTGLTKRNAHTFVINLDGTGLRQVTDSSGDEYDADMMPDGETVVFSHSPGDTWRLYMTRLGDSLFIPLPTGAGNATMPSLATDGSKVAFCLVRPGDNDPEIAILDLKTKEVSVLTDDVFAENSPRFSYDGKSVVFFGNTDLDYEVYMMDLATRQVRRLTDSWGADLSPSFDPTDAFVYFVSNRMGNGDIFRLEVKTGRLVRLTTDPADDMQPAVSRDGHWLVCASARSGSLELVLFDLTKLVTRDQLARVLGIEIPKESP